MKMLLLFRFHAWLDENEIVKFLLMLVIVAGGYSLAQTAGYNLVGVIWLLYWTVSRWLYLRSAGV